MRLGIHYGPPQTLARIILLLGEHKGYAVSMMPDFLSGELTGSVFGAGIYGPYPASHRNSCGHLMLALNIGGFVQLSEFNVRRENLIA